MFGSKTRHLSFARLVGKILLLVLIGMFAAEMSFANDSPRFSPPSIEWLRYLKSLESGDKIKSAGSQDGYGRGAIPSPKTWNPSGRPIPSVFLKKGIAATPAAFDLRNLNPLKVPPVRNQNPYGTCWTFATYSSLETALRPTTQPDFSEWHMAHTHGFDHGWNAGGNFDMSAPYLLRGSGPIAEADCPYNSGPVTGTYERVGTVFDVLRLGDGIDAGVDAIKNALYDNETPVGIMYNHNTDHGEWNSSYNTYWMGPYYGGYNADGHAVAIVGWDDTFPRERFNEVIINNIDPENPVLGRPTTDGAWIVRNSWGTGFGDGGYFYMSYEDTPNFWDCALFPSRELATPISHIFQHDPLGATGSFTFSGVTEQKIANVFQNDTGRTLRIAAIGIYTDNADETATVDLRDGADAANPEGGTSVFESTTNYPVPGYHVIPLNDPLPEIPNGGTFSVIQTAALSAEPISFVVEKIVPLFSSGATSQAGQSFFFDPGTGTWKDLYEEYSANNPNFCIKVYGAELAGPSFLDFSIPNQIGNATVTEETAEIIVHMPFNVDLGDLTPEFTVEPDYNVYVNNVEQVSGATSHDFSESVTTPIEYEIRNKKLPGIKKTWNVSVVNDPPRTDADILTFGFTSPLAAGTVNNAAQTVAVTVPNGTNLTTLVATFTLSDGATASVNGTPQVSGTTPNNFTNPVTYRILAEDGVTFKDWIVTVTRAAPTPTPTPTPTVPPQPPQPPQPTVTPTPTEPVSPDVVFMFNNGAVLTFTDMTDEMNDDFDFTTLPHIDKDTLAYLFGNNLDTWGLLSFLNAYTADLLADRVGGTIYVTLDGQGYSQNGEIFAELLLVYNVVSGEWHVAPMNPPNIGTKAWTNILTMSVVDGGPYDADEKADGQVSLLFGKALAKGTPKDEPNPTVTPTVAPTGTPSSGGGGGCNVGGGGTAWPFLFLFSPLLFLVVFKR